MQSRRHHPQRCDQRVREERSVAAGSGASERDVGGETGAQCDYSAGISACEKGGQWQRALSLLSEMWEAKLEPNVIPWVTYNAGISACGKGEQWQRAGELFCEMWEAKLEPDVISYTAGIGAWQQALALLGEMSEAKLEPNVISYSAGISACETGGRWQQALALLGEMSAARIETNVVIYTGGISACEEGGSVAVGSCAAPRDVGGEGRDQSHQLQLRDPRVQEGRAVAAGCGTGQRDVAGENGARRLSYCAVIDACEQCVQWHRALALLIEM
ncbi:unnamed protein product [Prorocentrum cordatum]|uniref:Pentatricopeptide repeat-containing protein, chloroplastic n=1 Tax=Prorocentrum cordatum TaxID=2364126 RepID=A0ABN9PJ28_9DINO|nr:unnamed protein product [Polarella glacialis]